MLEGTSIDGFQKLRSVGTLRSINPRLRRASEEPAGVGEGARVGWADRSEGQAGSTWR